MTSKTPPPPKKRTRPLSDEKPSPSPARLPTPEDPIVVGVGASAGGLEALKKLVEGFPEVDSICLIVAQHMSPSRESLLREILAPKTRFQVVYVEDSVKPKGGYVYIIPPGSDAMFESNKLMLMAAGKGGVGPRPSVTRLFKSMAKDLGPRCVGVILSGTGSDGADGMIAIRAAGGVGIVQDIETAQYSGMPQAAIDAGSAEAQLPPENIGGLISELSLGHPQLKHPVNENAVSEQTFELIGKRMREVCRIDLNMYKRSTLYRRIDRRMQALSLKTMEEYAEAIEKSDVEAAHLASEIRIGVTSFFRDSSSFIGLRERLTQIISEMSPGDAFRSWAPACSTGEEAYTVALTVAEIFKELGVKNPQWTVFASDINSAAVNVARAGTYPITELNRIPSAYHHYLNINKETFTVDKAIRTNLIFATHDILADPPFSRLHAITCRNLLIYLQNPAQRHVISMLHYGLVSGGVLMLGQAETADAYRELFDSIDSRSKIFRRRDVVSTFQVHGHKFNTRQKDQQNQLDKSATAEPTTTKSAMRDIENRTRSILAAQYAPPTIVINDDDRIVHFSGDLTPFVNLPKGPADWHAPGLIRSPMNVEARPLIGRARRSGDPVKGDKYTLEINGRQVQVQPKAVPTSFDGTNVVLLSFETVPLPAGWLTDNKGEAGEAPSDLVIDELSLELANTRAHLQSVIEEVETTNEELQTLNEELQSANEELQSTNEELQTSNEELQSTNEELSTTNQELADKSEELETSRADLQNVKECLAYGLIVVDTNHAVTQYNVHALDYLDPSSICTGVSLNKLRWSGKLTGLGEDCATVQESEKPLTRTILGQDQKYYRLDYAPYQKKNVNEGVVILINDVTQEQTNARLLQQREALYRVMFDSGVSGMTLVDVDGVIRECNRTLAELIDGSPKQSEGTNFHQYVHPDDQAVFRAALAAFRLGEDDYRQLEIRLLSSRGNWTWAGLSASPITNDKGECEAIVMQIQDISARRKRQQKLVDEYTQLRVLNGLLRQIATSQNPEEITNNVLANISVVFEDSRVSLLERTEGNSYKRVLSPASAGWEPDIGREFHFGRSPSYLRDLQSKQILSINNIDSEEYDLSADLQADMKKCGTEAWIDVAVLHGNEFRYILRAENRQPRTWSDSDFDMMQGVADALTLAQGAQVAMERSIVAREKVENQYSRANNALQLVAAPLFATDQHGLIVNANEAAIRWSGKDERDLIGSPLFRVAKFIDTDSQKVLPNLIEACLREDLRIEHEAVLVQRPDGVSVQTKAVAAPVHHADGHVIGASLLLEIHTEIEDS